MTFKEVKTRKDLKKYIEFPNKLYKNNKYYVPALYSEERDHLKRKNNPFSSYIEWKSWLLYNDDNKIVGRVTGIINHAFNKDKNVKQVRFNRIDFINDFDVCKALIDKVIDWGKKKGMNEIIGPIGFTDMDKEGLLTFGYNEQDQFITLYHYPYYKEFLEKLGFKVDATWHELELDLTTSKAQSQMDKLITIGEKIENRGRYRLEKVKCRFSKQMKNLANDFWDILNKAYKDLYGFQELPKNVQHFYFGNFLYVINLDYLWFVYDNEDDSVVAFGLMIPSLSDATKKGKGKITLFNLWRYIKAIHGKHKILDMYLVGIRPEARKLGAAALIWADGCKMVRKNGVTIARTGPQLSNNFNELNMWDNFGPELYRKRVCYNKKIK